MHTYTAGDQHTGYTVRETKKGWIVAGHSNRQGDQTGYKVFVPAHAFPVIHAPLAAVEALLIWEYATEYFRNPDGPHHYGSNMMVMGTKVA